MHHLFDYINRMLTELVAALEVLRGLGGCWAAAFSSF